MLLLSVLTQQSSVNWDDEDQLFGAIIGQEIRVPRTVSANSKSVLLAVGSLMMLFV